MARHVPKGRPVHDAEARGIQALVHALPDNYVVYSNVELPSDRRGQTYEHDAVVIAPHAVFTVELKSWGGRITGNRDRWTLDDGTIVVSPIPLVVAKARVLKGRLQARRRELGNVWVQGLVFLSASDAVAKITTDYEDLVATPDEIERALTDATWLGRPPPITLAQRRAIEEYLDDGRPVRAQDRIDDFRLVQRLATEDRPYDAWLAERTSLTRERRVLHAYTIDGETESERDRLRAHALREATLHTRLQGGPDVLRYETYFITREDPQRIVLLFEDTTPLVPLDVWVRDRNPGLHARLAVAARVARSLAWVHEKGLVHRRLSPEAVLVSSEETPTDVRLCAFELARDLTGAAPTITGSSLGDPTFRCVAPEVLRTAEATARSDLFSLGATLVELFSGRALFANVDEVLRPFSVPPLVVGDRPVPKGVAQLVAALLAVDPARRPASAAEAAEGLDDALSGLGSKPSRVELGPGTVIREVYELQKRLGRGATATTWKARHLQTDREVVLKIADDAHAVTLQDEARLLTQVHHPSLVRFHNIEPFEGGNLLVLEYVPGFTAAEWAAAGDPMAPSQFLGVARGVLGALGALHEAGFVHRDVKPDNVMVDEGGGRAKVLDVGLAGKLPIEGDLAVGSVRYKDPLVYVENRWTPANDQFSAFLVLYELLTGAHPFGGVPPEPSQKPTLQADDLPEGFEGRVGERLVALFEGALSPLPDDRPRGVAAAIRDVEQALGAAPPEPKAPPAEAPGLLPERADLTTSLSTLDLSTRTQGALVRLGLATVADLVGFDPSIARGLRNVGTKTVRELRALVAAIEARWPGEAPGTRVPTERFYPALAGDVRPLDELGREMTPSMRTALVARGVLTLGDLASMPPLALAQIPHVGPAKLDRLRRALRRVAGREEVPETLAELDGKLREELGESSFAALSGVVGLADGVARGGSEVAAALGVTRQRVSQATDLEPLRAEASWAHWLATVLVEALPPAGFATLEAAGALLAARLPPGEGGASPLGHARLAALVLAPDARAADAAAVGRVVRPPWTEALIDDLLGRLAGRANWPPLPRAQAEADLWDAVPVDVQRALVRWGADAAHLLDALLRLDDGVRLDRLGGLYTPPVDLAAALAALRPGLVPVVDATALIAEAEAAYAQVLVPPDAAGLDAAIERAGYRKDGDRWVDPARVEAAARVEAPRVDPTIPTQRVAGDGQPPVVATLAAQADRGGFRVVALPPSLHHVLGRRLAAWLAERLAPERVAYVHFDRVVLDALKASDLWKFVPFLEARADADWRMFHAELASALDAAVAPARPGVVTVLGQPSLLGPMGLMDWLSGFYERARGGRHGLVVLAVPGGIHEDRVRLNEKYNLPYTPDMAAVYLDAGGHP